MRKLATIRNIDDIIPIPGADNIECAVVGGWVVVVKKGQFRKNGAAIYVEIDSWVPTEIAPFLSKGKEPREYNGIKGERLRTVKLLGQISQGLLLDIYDYPAVSNAFHKTRIIDPNVSENFDVTEILGIQKFEPPIPAQLSGMVKGYFPIEIPKTDQERCQNLVDSIKGWSKDSVTWEVTEKLDGCSMTVYRKNGEFGVCSRNLDLKEDVTNSLWATARSQGIIDALAKIPTDIAFQGELIGEGIQGNPYKIKGQKFYVFDIFDIKSGKYLSPEDRIALCKELEMEHVPVISHSATISDNVMQILAMAEGKSVLHASTEREGLVFKANSLDGVSFKAISNRFLIKTGG